MQAKEYGRCIAVRVPEVEHDMCLKEFLALKACMQNSVIFLSEGKDLIKLSDDAVCCFLILSVKPTSNTVSVILPD
jgi:hypothetical protein